MTNIEELKDRLNKAKDIDDILDRRLWVLSIITRRLEDIGIKPVLVGGAAVEFYTAGGYATHDIDVIMPALPLISTAFSELGFQNVGRYWIREDIDIAIEAPSSELAGDIERVTELQIEDMSVYIIGIEDLVVDRLNAFVHWKSTEDGRWAKRMIESQRDNLDMPYLFDRAKHEKVDDALSTILQELD